MIWQSWLGFFSFAAVAWLLSEDRRRIPWRPVMSGMGLQLLLAVVLIRVPAVKAFFFSLNDAVSVLVDSTRQGTSFVFGHLGGGAVPFTVTSPNSSFILAFQALPLVLVISALSSLLFYWKILPWIVRGCSWLLQKSMGIGGALGISTAANVFVGMVEAPLLIQPYLKMMSRGELFAVMTGGMATVAGTVMVLYALILEPVVPDALGHILIASLISAPAALSIAMLMVPSTTQTTGNSAPPTSATSSMDAIARGTVDGIALLINIIGFLIVLIALVALANHLLTWLPAFDGTPLTLQRLLGWIMAPFTWLMGIPWQEAHTAGSLMGIKTTLNELLAYLELAKLPPEALSPRSRVIMTYALCGFANFGSLGIMLGGMGGMVPERREELVELGLKSILSGTLATLMTGSVLGIVWE